MTSIFYVRELSEQVSDLIESNNERRRVIENKIDRCNEMKYQLSKIIESFNNTSLN